MTSGVLSEQRSDLPRPRRGVTGRGAGRRVSPAPRVRARSRPRHTNGRDQIQVVHRIAFICRDAAGPRQRSLAAAEGTRLAASSSVGLREGPPTDARPDVARRSLAGVLGRASRRGAVRARARAPAAHRAAPRRPRLLRARGDASPRALPRGGGPGAEGRCAAARRATRTVARAGGVLGGDAAVEALVERTNAREQGGTNKGHQNSHDPSPDQRRSSGTTVKNEHFLLNCQTPDACRHNQQCCRSALRRLAPRDRSVSRPRASSGGALSDSRALSAVPVKGRDRRTDDGRTRVPSARREARVPSRARPWRPTAGTPGQRSEGENE